MTEQNYQKRPRFLLVICILSLVWSGSAFFIGLVNLSKGPATQSQMKEALVEMDKNTEELKKNGMHSWVPTFQKLRQMTIESNNKFYPIQLTNILVMAIGILGVVQMLRGFKIGFHLYIIYSLLAIMQHYMFMSPTIIPTFLVVINLFFAGLFISMYAANLKSLR